MRHPYPFMDDHLQRCNFYRELSRLCLKKVGDLYLDSYLGPALDLGGLQVSVADLWKRSIF
jgi:hypothetical protein